MIWIVSWSPGRVNDNDGFARLEGHVGEDVGRRARQKEAVPDTHNRTYTRGGVRSEKHTKQIPNLRSNKFNKTSTQKAWHTAENDEEAALHHKKPSINNEFPQPGESLPKTVGNSSLGMFVPTLTSPFYRGSIPCELRSRSSRKLAATRAAKRPS